MDLMKVTDIVRNMTMMKARATVLIMKESDDHGHHESCVGEVLEAILHAQEKAKREHNEHHSCGKESISELLEEKKRSTKKHNSFHTIQ